MVNRGAGAAGPCTPFPQGRPRSHHGVEISHAWTAARATLSITDTANHWIIAWAGLAREVAVGPSIRRNCRHNIRSETWPLISQDPSLKGGDTKFASEFRDAAAARALVKSITELAGDGEYKFMEVCGGHTHTIYRHGLEHLLPPSVELVHGPGCPVCVIPMGRVDDAIWLAGRPDVIFTTFGDMMRAHRKTAILVGQQRAAAHG
jgi:hypothetical protein